MCKALWIPGLRGWKNVYEHMFVVMVIKVDFLEERVSKMKLEG